MGCTVQFITELGLFTTLLKYRKLPEQEPVIVQQVTWRLKPEWLLLHSRTVTLSCDSYQSCVNTDCVLFALQRTARWWLQLERFAEMIWFT